MSQDQPDRKTKKELLEEIRQLKEKARKLEQSGAETDEPTQGVAEGMAAALGRMIPGLQELIQSASQTPEFQRRLAEIDEEVKRKFKKEPLGRASSGIGGNVGRRRMGIPPSVRRGRIRRSGSSGAGESQPAGKGTRHGKRREPRQPKIHISPETPAQLPVDVFDEGSKIVVLAEAPGLNREDIKVSTDGTVLVLSVEARGRGGVQRIELPCEVAGEPEVSVANGIVNVHIRKAKSQ